MASASTQHHGVSSVIYPVFEGLENSNLSGKEIADIIGVSPPTLSKWKHGHARIPAAKLAFLTLLLANLVEELEDLYGGWENATVSWHLQMRAHLEAVRDSLGRQESFNITLSPEAIREGAKMFRKWWNESRESVNYSNAPSAAYSAAGEILSMDNRERLN